MENMGRVFQVNKEKKSWRVESYLKAYVAPRAGMHNRVRGIHLIAWPKVEGSIFCFDLLFAAGSLFDIWGYVRHNDGLRGRGTFKSKVVLLVDLDWITVIHQIKTAFPCVHHLGLRPRRSSQVPSLSPNLIPSVKPLPSVTVLLPVSLFTRLLVQSSHQLPSSHTSWIQPIWSKRGSCLR